MTILALDRPPSVRVSRAAAGFTAACAACWLAVAPVTSVANDGPPAVSAGSRVKDPAVRPAGGAGCHACGPGGCGQPHGQHHGHHAGCRDGVCVPYCPVRPQQFGFYGTQWRRWPGSTVVQVSGTRDAGPVSPPRSAVPGPSEESLNPQAEQEPVAGQAADAGGAATPAAPRQSLPEPAAPREPVAEPAAPRVLEPAPEMRREPPVESAPKADSVPQPATESAPAPNRDAPPPPAEPGPLPAEPAAPAPGAKPRPEDENLFEAVSVSGVEAGRRAQRRFAVGAAADEGAGGPRAGRVEPASHLDDPAPTRVPRVLFDPAAETRRLRSNR